MVSNICYEPKQNSNQGNIKFGSTMVIIHAEPLMERNGMTPFGLSFMFQHHSPASSAHPENIILQILQDKDRS
jgi:hypothetical protein